MRCTYCAFNVYTDQEALIGTYVNALTDEIAFVGQQRRLDVHTVYFGGGTPSLLTPAQVARILEAVAAHMHLRSDAEVTLEANPGKIDHTYFTGLRSAGVNRLSLGMQSAHEQELALFGRLHRMDAVRQAVTDARRARFENLSLDLIYGNPHQTREMWQTTLHAALELEPDHFSLYALILKSGTDMTRRIKYGELPAPDDDLTADMYDDATVILGAAGYDQYELSSWGRPSAHNLQYWRNLPYIGLGAGAHGYVQRTRTVNAMRPEVYIRRLQSTPSENLTFPTTPATIKTEPVDDAADMAETLFMGLRLLHEGVAFADFARRYDIALREHFPDELATLSRRGLILVDAERVRLTQQARLISNVVFREFLEDV